MYSRGGKQVQLDGMDRPLLHATDRTPLLVPENRYRTSRCSLEPCRALSGGFAFLAVIIASGGEQVMRKVVASNLYHYRWFLVQLMSLGTALAAAFAIAFTRIVYRQPVQWKTLSWRPLALMCLLDTTHSMMMMTATGVVPFPLALLLPQLLVPLALLFSCSHGGCRGGPSQRVRGPLCAILFIGGVVAAFLPCMQQYPPDPCPPNGPTCGRSQREIIVNVIILIVATVPAAIGAVYKQRKLAKAAVDMRVLALVLASAQFLLGFALGPAVLQLQYADATPLSAVLAVAPSMAGKRGRGLAGLPPTPASSVNASLVEVVEVVAAVAALLPAGLNATTAPPGSQLGGMTAQVTGIFTNIGNALQCLSGVNQEVGDVCAEQGGWLLMQLGLYCAFAALVPVALTKALQAPAAAENGTTCSLAAAVLAAFVFLSITHTALLPAYLYDGGLDTWYPWFGVAIFGLAMVVSQWATETADPTIDIWERLEHEAFLDQESRAPPSQQR